MKCPISSTVAPTFSILMMSILCGTACVEQVLAQDSTSGSKHVVVVVWDGMRPDMMTEKNCPTLWRLAQEGVNFRNHHSVYPSATNVNGTALVTGVYPGRSGIIANHIYRADIDAKRAIDVEVAAVVAKGDEISGGKYIGVPTIAELVQAAGRRTAVAAAKTVGLLLDRHLAGRGQNSVAIFAGNSVPRDAVASMRKTLGNFPPATNGFAGQDSWTTKALIDFLWKEDVPAFSVLWLAEPDGTQHFTAPGTDAALRAIKSADTNLGLVLATLDRCRARSTTDVFVVSDHGFSTIARANDLPNILKGAGFNIFTEFAAEPKRGDIMMVGNGGSVLFYVIEHDASTRQRLVDFLEQSHFAGVIFTKEKMEGTFTLEQGKIDPPSRRYGAAGNEHAPDVVMAFRWTDAKSEAGVAGMIDADWQRVAGQGTHATLGRFDMHNTLVAAGPDFRRGFNDDTASGNVDLAPTILQILGMKPPPMDGRVLSEAMRDEPAPQATTETIAATNKFPIGAWHQYLRRTRVGSTIYLDEGNGEFVATKTEND
jgi:arylsulfatase A-like enzyme